MACFDGGVLAFLDNNNKDYFDVYFLLAYPPGISYFEDTLGGKCLVHHSNMHKIEWSEIHFHFCYHYSYKNLMIYQDNLNDGREKVWSKT